METHLGRSEAAWGAYLRARETDQFLLLYYGKNAAVVLPKRAFSQQDLVGFRELTAQHVAGAAK
jgi:YcxB-like protein